MLDFGSLKIASATDAFLATTSKTPMARRASMRDKVGLRRSQSTRRTRPPTCAMRCARAAAIVDFPSLGSVDVKPITLHGRVSICRSIVNLIERIASAKLDKGESMTVRNTLRVFGHALRFVSDAARNCLMPSCAVFSFFTSGTRATHGTCSSASSCFAVRKTRSIRSRRMPRPTQADAT